MESSKFFYDLGQNFLILVFLYHELFPAQDNLISQASQNAVYHKRTAETDMKVVFLQTLPLSLDFSLSREHLQNIKHLLPKL